MKNRRFKNGRFLTRIKSTVYGAKKQFKKGFKYYFVFDTFKTYKEEIC